MGASCSFMELRSIPACVHAGVTELAPHRGTPACSQIGAFGGRGSTHLCVWVRDS